MSRVTVDTRKLNAILKSVDGNTEKVTRKVAFAVERESKKLAPVDLGPLSAGIYVRGVNDNDLPSVPAPVNRVELPTPSQKGAVVVGPSVDYAVHQEYGTSKMAAQPFLGPAVTIVENDLQQFYGDYGKALSGG